ncbi:MAG: Hg(II)-responsive transcriptional regulator [Rubrivivax sp.]|nr:Hg(II)-responsive transcriptional regulator [Rubrivivax sp.]
MEGSILPYLSTESSAMRSTTSGLAPDTGLTIGTLAAAAGVNVETIRFYQRRGLLPEPERPSGSVRRYGPADLARVRFVKSAQRSGFSLDEVAQLLQLEDGTRCSEAREIALHRLLDVRQRLADLQRIEAALAALVARCAGGRGRVACPLIASLQEAV